MACLSRFFALGNSCNDLPDRSITRLCKETQPDP